MDVTLSGLSFDWLRWNSSWGALPDEPMDARNARDALLQGEHRKVGFGTRVRVELTADEAESLRDILDSIAGAGESMTSEERGSDASSYRAMSRDADRIAKQLKEAS